MTGGRRSRAASSARLARLAGRVGLVAHGVLYLAFAALAARLAATGNGGGDRTGAIAGLADDGFGAVVLIVLGIGLTAYALWRASLAWRGVEEPDADSESASRLANGGRALVAAAVAVVAWQSVLGDGGGSGGGGSGGGGSGGGAPGGGRGGGADDQTTAEVLTWPGGPWLVAAAGLAVGALGGWQLYKALTGRSRARVETERAPRQGQRWLGLVAVAGDAGRGAAFALVAWFLVRAAMQHDPNESKTLDESLQAVAGEAWGRWVLAVLAVGLASFATSQLTEAFVRRRRHT